MTRIVAILTSIFLAFALGTPVVAQTVILVRHAEKADQSADPVLSGEGEARAQALADRLGASSIDLILTSSLQRTRLTAAATAEAYGIEPVAIALDTSTEAHVADLVARVRAAPETSTILIVGHSNTVPMIARALGQNTPDMPDCEYDRLLTLKLQGESVFGVTGRYGARSEC
jgi:broad specificity phosphatase PhoE